MAHPAAAGGDLDASTPDENLFINASDGLPNEHPALPSAYDSENESNPVDDGLLEDLPTSIIVTNIHSEVFASVELKARMEELFKTFSENATFQWLKSFRRLRVNYDTALAAANARIQLHQYQFGKSIITCYLAQPVTPVSNKNLKPPAPVKQFLISPPASPPAGWEPAEENEPLVNHDLLAALANLTPGVIHEIHAQTDNHPGIVLHTANMGMQEDGHSNKSSGGSSFDDDDEDFPRKGRIVQTRCPERQDST
ncbi:protein sarah [Toxorhynchites rutilus septentrionalis]|uniref:protein sarah n=1 Tax=Toxorhynchites rutilus septentrionalis TaxID=329112 RepID=UPI00247A8CFE|nr:protein sarah [Toxorhynchites rutilus septentrionalis]XP_055631167.1 protein sarah [Toxorhynchites rutilus septentrionalis]